MVTTTSKRKKSDGGRALKNQPPVITKEDVTSRRRLFYLLTTPIRRSVTPIHVFVLVTSGSVLLYTLHKYRKQQGLTPPVNISTSVAPNGEMGTQPGAVQAGGVQPDKLISFSKLSSASIITIVLLFVLLVMVGYTLFVNLVLGKRHQMYPKMLRLMIVTNMSNLAAVFQAKTLSDLVVIIVSAIIVFLIPFVTLINEPSILKLDEDSEKVDFYPQLHVNSNAWSVSGDPLEIASYTNNESSRVGQMTTKSHIKLQRDQLIHGMKMIDEMVKNGDRRKLDFFIENPMIVSAGDSKDSYQELINWFSEISGEGKRDRIVKMAQDIAHNTPDPKSDTGKSLQLVGAFPFLAQYARSKGIVAEVHNTYEPETMAVVLANEFQRSDLFLKIGLTKAHFEGLINSDTDEARRFLTVLREAMAIEQIQKVKARNKEEGIEARMLLQFGKSHRFMAWNGLDMGFQFRRVADYGNIWSKYIGSIPRLTLGIEAIRHRNPEGIMRKLFAAKEAQTEARLERKKLEELMESYRR